MLNKLVEPILIIAVLCCAMALSQHMNAKADQRKPTEAEQHQQMRNWSAKRACPKGHEPEWIDDVTMRCLKVLP